jgi:hypothetical protein
LFVLLATPVEASRYVAVAEPPKPDLELLIADWSVMLTDGKNFLHADPSQAYAFAAGTHEEPFHTLMKPVSTHDDPFQTRVGIRSGTRHHRQQMH